MALPFVHDGHLTCVLKVIFFNDDSKPSAHFQLCLEYFDLPHELAFGAIIHIPIASQIAWHTFVLISDKIDLSANGNDMDLSILLLITENTPECAGSG